MSRDLPIEKKSIAIIIPALNEAETIGRIVSLANQFGLAIVVDDGSSDNTAAIARENGAQVVVHTLNQGYDGALNSGFKQAENLGCNFAVTLDADGQHNPKILQEFIKLFNQGIDIVIGVRDRRQRISEHIFGLVTQVLWGVKDPLCGMKGYSLGAYHRLGHFDSFGSIGTELAIFAVRNKFRLSQISICTHDRMGYSRFGFSFRADVRILRAMLIILWRAYFKPFHG